MAEVAQYVLSHKELLEILIKENDIHEGHWSLTIGFQIGVGPQGPSPDQVFPGVSIAVNQIGIQRIPEGQQTSGPGNIVVDAKVTNPARSSKKMSKS